MRTAIDQKEGHWTLFDMQDIHWVLLTAVVEVADLSSSEKGRKRLLPDLMDTNDDPEASADWAEYTQPDIEDSFSRNLAVVSNALEKAEEYESEDGESVRRLHVPLDDAETWYLVFNQARLMLNEECDVASFQNKLFLGELDPEEMTSEAIQRMGQYEFYTALQDRLLRLMA